MAVVITVTGMTCGGCVSSVEKALARAGIAGAQVEIGRARITADDEESVARAKAAIEKAGFDVSAVTPAA